MRFVGLADSSLIFCLCFLLSRLYNILKNSSTKIYEDTMLVFDVDG